MTNDNKCNDIKEVSIEISLTFFLVIVMQNDLVTGNEEKKNEPTWKQCLLGVGSHINNWTLYIYNLILRKKLRNQNKKWQKIKNKQLNKTKTNQKTVAEWQDEDDTWRSPVWTLLTVRCVHISVLCPAGHVWVEDSLRSKQNKIAWKKTCKCKWCHYTLDYTIVKRIRIYFVLFWCHFIEP